MPGRNGAGRGSVEERLLELAAHEHRMQECKQLSSVLFKSAALQIGFAKYSTWREPW
jgi:hypothetical protein